MPAPRERAADLARQHAAGGTPLAWFEELYAEAKAGRAEVPWADMAPNAYLLEWLEQQATDLAGKQALVVGCGLGDDAEELSRRGLKVVAFDLSPTAIEWCAKRFPATRVRYRVADLFAAPRDWRGTFDLIVEIYTLQALPEAQRRIAISTLPTFLAPKGRLLLLARGRDAADPPGELPWPLTKEEIASFEHHGLRLDHLDDFADHESPPVRRFRAELTRTASGGPAA